MEGLSRSPDPAFAPLGPFLLGLAAELHRAHPAIPGFQWAVAQDDRVVVAGSRGLADADTREPLTRFHAVQAASNAKPIAAVVAAILADRGVLNIDAAADTLIARGGNGAPLPAHLAPLTLRQLLSHTSGLGVRGYPQIPWEQADPPTARQIFDGHFGPGFEPTRTALQGTSSLYSAAGFTLAQFLIEHASGTNIAGLVEQLVAHPLRLRALWLGRREPAPVPLAAQHDESGRRLPRSYYPALAASGLYSSAAHLARFYAGFPGLLSPDRLGELLTPHGTAENGWKFGLGFALAECNGGHIGKHAGWSTGCWGAAEGIPARRIGAAVLCTGAAGKDVALPLLGAAIQWLTTH